MRLPVSRHITIILLNTGKWKHAFKSLFFHNGSLIRILPRSKVNLICCCLTFIWYLAETDVHRFTLACTHLWTYTYEVQRLINLGSDIWTKIRNHSHCCDSLFSWSIHLKAFLSSFLKRWKSIKKEFLSRLLVAPMLFTVELKCVV